MQITAPMEYGWERLRWARHLWMQSNLDCVTAEDAARRFGWKPVTYRSHERAPEFNGRGFDAQTAREYARAFGVSWIWLYAGEGDPMRPNDAEFVEICDWIGVDVNGRPLCGHGPTGDFAPRPSRHEATAELVEVKGFLLPFFAEDGALIWFDHKRTYPTPDMVGHFVIVALDTGELLVRRLLRGPSAEAFDLQAFSGEVSQGLRPAWVARIVAIVPPLEARRVVVRGYAHGSDLSPRRC